MKINNIYNKIKIGFGRIWRNLSYVTGNSSYLLRHTSYVIFCLLALTACIDDRLDVNCSDDSSSSDNAKGQLSFTISLKEDVASRDGEVSDVEAYENYIDTDNFRVLFLADNGDFLFEAATRTIEKQENSNDYKVTINLNNITGFETKVIREYLTANSFRIAVLANWHDENGVKFSETWGWDNSALNSSVSNKKTINDLHHIASDSYYSNSSRRNAYDFIMKDGNMGFNCNWVEYRDETKVNGKAGAYTWIRNYWDPLADKNNEPVYRSYSNLWQLWNFGGSYDNNAITYSDLDAATFSSQWNQRNGDDLETWLGSVNDNELRELKTVDGLTLDPGDGYKIVDNSNNSKEEVGWPKVVHVNNYHGIMLPRTQKIESNGTIGFSDSEHAHGFLQFTAPATGELRVKYGKYGDNTSKLTIQRSSNLVTTLEATKNTGEAPEEYYNSKVQITGDAEPITIFCSEGNVVIYSIEFICGEYLNDTDRIGIAPSQDYPIPMYGVQRFKMIDSWTMYNDDEPYNLSTGGEGRGEIALIRSVAKVELYFTVNPKHVFMRCLNRMARCETMDVVSATSETFGSSHDNEHCEWFRIQSRGSGYNSQTVTFNDWIGWLYGSWTEWDWNWNGKTVTDKKSEYGNYPRIYNPDAERSDFAQCLYAGPVSVNGISYQKYVLYMPDKNIMDSNSEGGVLNGNAKVAHIEYRYDNGSENLDDNACHRLYFTDYENNEFIKGLGANQYEDILEKSATELDKLWPIMRNHVYRFYVNSKSQDTQEITVNVSVKPWQYEQSHDEW